MKRLPKAIQIFFTDDRNGNELAHDYYLNAAWVTELCDRYGALNVGRFIYRSVEAKREACIKRYGSEWGREKKILGKKRKSVQAGDGRMTEMLPIQNKPLYAYRNATNFN